MVDVEEIIRAEIDAFASETANVAPDWQEVVTRANRPASGPSAAATGGERLDKRRRTLLVALALLVFVTVLVATPAFGVQSLIRDVIGGRKNVQFARGSAAPTLVKREFSDLGLGAPSGMAPQAIASEARTVTHIRVSGHSRALFVAPTRSGGFCWQIEHSMGGCQSSLADLRKHVFRYQSPGQIHPELLGVSFMSGRGANPSPRFVEAVIRSDAVTHVTASFRDGYSVDLSFIFVSPPIDAGFLEWTVPANRQTHTKELVSLTALDKAGKVVARITLPPMRLPHRPLPTTTIQRPLANPQGFKLPPPTAPFQRGSGNGVSVTLGANGVAVFDLSGLSAERRAVSRSYSPGCFKLEHDAAGLWVRGLGAQSRRFGQTIRARFLGLKPPLDGCTIGGDYGHRWPDRFGSHSVVEIALSPAGARYFTDRAAARDLAAFVRQGTIQHLRHQRSAAIRTGLARYAPRVAPIRSAAAALTAGRIGSVVTGKGVTFVEVSPTGKRFEVVVESGKIKHQNLSPYAFVF